MQLRRGAPWAIRKVYGGGMMCDVKDCNEKAEFIHKDFVEGSNDGKVCQDCYDFLITKGNLKPEDFERIN